MPDHNLGIFGYIPRYCITIFCATESDISTEGEPVLSVSLNLSAPIPYPRPSIAVLPTYLSSLSSLVIVRPYICEANSQYTSRPVAKACTSSCSLASQASIRASILDKSAMYNRCPSGAMIARLSVEPLGRFCRLILSEPPKRPVCAA